MELKHEGVRRRHGARETFNRTTMELKRALLKSYIDRAGTFNRTTMELKLRRFRYRGLPGALLIEPLWN